VPDWPILEYAAYLFPILHSISKSFTFKPRTRRITSTQTKTHVMKRIVICLALATCTAVAAEGQLLKKLKEKVEKKVTDKIDKPSDNSSGNNGNSSQNDPMQESGAGRPVNKGGAGLKNTPPPDVNQQIAEAGQFHESGKYSEARYSIQQALVGVEIQLGREILKSLPSNISALPADTLQDKVSTTHWGWSNMTIQRVYTDKKDKQLTISIGNNIMYTAMVNVYFNNSYVQANADNQNTKPVKVKGYKAILTYDDSKGYTLILPLGQTSMIVWECINFANEDEVMAAANSFDIDGIKKTLGEK
jgi:hypothetical protein